MKLSDMLPGGNGTWTLTDWAGWLIVSIAIGAIGFGTLGLLGII